MASPELPDKGTRTDPMINKGAGIKPPPKMVQVDELEASIKKILERTLRKATLGFNPATKKVKSRGKKKPLPEKRVLPVAPWGSGMTNTVLFSIKYIKVR